jgi:hypothetical protein
MRSIVGAVERKKLQIFGPFICIVPVSSQLYQFQNFGCQVTRNLTARATVVSCIVDHRIE